MLANNKVRDMTKKRINKQKQKKQGTNWKVVGGIVVISALALVGMMALAFREPNRNDLAKYCDNNPENCITVGSNDAKARIVEISDYGCSHCKAYNLEVAPLLEETYFGHEDVQYLVMPYALGGSSGYTYMPSAVAAMCANEQDGFWEYHHALFENQGSPGFNTEAGLMDTAVSLGLDGDEFASCLADNDYEDIIRENISTAGFAGINSTPSFIIDGDVLVGEQPFSVFQMRIEGLINN